MRGSRKPNHKMSIWRDAASRRTPWTAEDEARARYANLPEVAPETEDEDESEEDESRDES